MPAGTRSLLPLMAIMAITLAVAGLVTLLLPGLPYAFVSVPLDVLVNDTALLVGTGVIWLALLRFREGGDPPSGLIAAAFLVSAGLNLLVITAEASGADVAIGMSLTAPTQEPLYLHATVRLIMAATLLLGGLAATGRWTPPRGSWWIPLPLALALISGVVIHLGVPVRPPWVSDAGLRQLADRGTGQPLQGVTAVAVSM
jgi:hypothetical protein